MAGDFVRRSVVLAVSLVALSAWAGKGKILEFKTMPRTVDGLAKQLEKEKDAVRRMGLAMVLDQMLREKPETTDLKVYDEIGHLLLDKVLDQLAADTEVFEWPGGELQDEFAPRGDVLGKGEARIYPGRISKNFRRTYIKTPRGKRVDRGFRGQPCRVNINVPDSEDEYFKWVEKEGFGIQMHSINIDGQYARAAMNFVSPGKGDKPPRHERPVFVAFFKQPKPGTPWTVLSIEQVTALDYREQEVNIIPPRSAQVSDWERKLRLAVWFEDVRTINPSRKAFTSEEERLFNLAGEGADKLEPAQLPLLEPYRMSDHPMVRAAAELKAIELGGATTPSTVDFILKTLKHPVAIARLKEARARASDAPPDAGAPRGDGGK